MDSYVIDEIIAATKDEKSRRFFEKAVRTLGEERVAVEWSEAKYQNHTRKIKNLAKYITALLKKQMIMGSRGGNRESQGNQLKTHFEETQESLFKSLEPVKGSGEVIEKAMKVPYSPKTIPWVTYLTPSFFTLSTNKAKSDKVTAKFKLMDGQTVEVEMVRGRLNPGGEEYGILTVEHGRILAAVEGIWVEQGCQYNKWASGAVSCYCYVSVSELASLLGWETKNIGGKDLKRLQDMVFHMKQRPYWLDLDKLGWKDMDCSFTLLKDVVRMSKRRHGIKTVFKVEFSMPLSVHLLRRHAVSRPKEIAQIRSELAFLLRLHLEPILMGLSGQAYGKSLKDLVNELCLPPAKWHRYESQRKNVFEKAVGELNRQKTVDGRPIFVTIEKGLFDWMLTARLGNPEKVIELQAATAGGTNGAGNGC